MKSGWRSRGYLPHLETRSAQFVTWRLADSLPPEVLMAWELELGEQLDEARKKEILRRIGNFLDQGHGSCILRRADIAQIVQSSLLRSHGNDVTLMSWVVMPNHVHVLFQVCEGASLARVIKHWKGASARAINDVLGRSGTMWQPDYFDTAIRSIEHAETVRQYIEWNPVKAGLCADPRHWPFSSAHEANQMLLTKVGLKSDSQAE